MKTKTLISLVIFQLIFFISGLHSMNSFETDKKNELAYDIENTGYQVTPDSVNNKNAGNSSIEVSPSSIFMTLQPNSSSSQKITLVNKSSSSFDFIIEDVETSKRIKAVPMNNGSHSDSPDDLLNFVKYQIKNGSSKARNISWMEKSISSINLKPGESIEIEFSFSSNNLPQDVYNAKILLSSSNSDISEILIPVTLFVTKGNCPYLQTEDNENNALQGVPDFDLDYYLGNDDPVNPIEFNFFIDEATITSAMLNIYAYDVDETGGPPAEIDEVYLNGNYLGILTGADEVWSSTSFEFNSSFLNPGPNGKNLVQIYVSVIPNTGWKLSVDWGQLIINNCQGGDAYIRTMDLDKTVYLPGDAITITSETDTELASQTVLVETNLLDENLFNVGGVTNTITINDIQDEPLPVSFSISGSAILGTEYKAQVIVYDANTYLFQDMVTLPVPIGNMAIEVFPESFNVSLCESESIIQIITISNTGDGDINYTNSSASAWISESPNAGTIMPGDNIDIQITIDATGLSAGYHNGEVLINSNVLTNPQISIPVTLEVVPPMASYSTINTGDNENNELSGTPDNDINSYLCKGDNLLPVEFNFFINQNTIESADLIIETYDVDQSGGFGLPYTEVNEVYVNGTLVGVLTGSNNGSATTTISVPPAIINPGPNGKNLVQIYVSVLGKYWCTNVQSAELRIYNCAGKQN